MPFDGGPPARDRRAVTTAPLKRKAPTVPPEPPQLTLWRKILLYRRSLVREIRLWDRPDHPAARDVRKIARIYGGHGLTDRRLAEIDTEAAARAAHFRQRLKALDDAIAKGSRDDADERGLSMRQMQDLLDVEQQLAIKKARAAVCRWLKAPADRLERHAAEWAIRRVAGIADNVNVDLEGLVDAEKKQRKRSGSSAQPERRALLIVAIATAAKKT